MGDLFISDISSVTVPRKNGSIFFFGVIVQVTVQLKLELPNMSRVDENNARWSYSNFNRRCDSSTRIVGVLSSVGHCYAPFIPAG